MDRSKLRTEYLLSDKSEKSASPDKYNKNVL